MLNIKKIFLFVLCGIVPVTGLYAANIATQYGLIQNVGNYSSMPGWRPDASYNQTFPHPVYVDGTDLKTDDCQRAVSAVIESYCASHNGCSGVRLVDVRGELLTQLARLPGHAFATACAGFVDTMFDEYVASRPLHQAAFPVATGGGANNTKTTPTFTEPTMPNWQAEYIDRVNELAELQAQNATGTGVNSADFPKTFSDLSFEERNEILAQGYEPYKDKSAYTPIEVEDLATFLSRVKSSNVTQTQADDVAVESGESLNQEMLELVDIIVSAMGPDTMEQKIFFTDLVKDYVATNQKNEKQRLDDAFVLAFLAEGKNLEKYKYGLQDLTGETVLDEYGVDVNWDDVLDVIADELEKADPKYGALVCENNRSWQVSIDAVGWGITAAAAVLTFYAGGAGGAAVATGRAAIGAGLKAASKGVAKVGGKVAAKKLSQAGGKQLAKSAVKLGLKANMRGYAKYAGKGVLAGGAKTFVKAVGQNLKKRVTRFLIAGALVWGVGKGNASNWATDFYTFVNSDATTDIITCKDLDHNEGCYTVCGDSTTANDDLNTKVFKPILNKTYCVNPTDYMLYEMKQDGIVGKVMSFDKTQWDNIKAKIKSDVADKGKCDWNEDDIDFYLGHYIYDPDTFEVSYENLVIEGVLRIDD